MGSTRILTATSWASLKSNGTLPGNSVWIKAADLMDQVQSGSTNVLLAKLKVRGDATGITNVTVSVSLMDDDSGGEINPDIKSGLLSVGSATTPSPTNLSIVINNGELYSNSTSVMLYLSAVNATEMSFSNDNSTWSGWVIFENIKQWLLTIYEPHHLIKRKYKNTT